FDKEIAEAIQMFVERLPGMFTSICEKYEAHNIERLKDLVHDLKGTSGNFGYDDLFAISKQMEELLKNSLMDEFGTILQEAERIVQSIILHPEKSSMIL
ncbi:MAG: Hpt domain-containing protein, partial [Gammaproteobacteria bacterium]|nr:Hpt domain-containing protein [Gammaproteobacteria bacterium]